MVKGLNLYGEFFDTRVGLTDSDTSNDESLRLVLVLSFPRFYKITGVYLFIKKVYWV